MSKVLNYDALAERARRPAPVDYDALASQARSADQVRQSVADASTVKPLIPRNASDWLSAAADFGKGVVNGLNPLPALQAMYDAGPVATIKGLAKSQIDQFTKAQDAYKAGRYSEAVGHTIAGALPLVGPAAAQAGEQIGEGKVAEGLGSATALLAPMAASHLPIKKSVFSMLTKNPAEAAAVKFGMDAGLPVDAATATGNPAIRAVQALSDKSPGGSLLNASAKAESAAKFTNKLGQMAQVPPVGPLAPNGIIPNPAQAGEAIQQGLQSKIAQYHGEANSAYGDLRKIEADPANIQRVKVGESSQSVQPQPPRASLVQPVPYDPYTAPSGDNAPPPLVEGYENSGRPKSFTKTTNEYKDLALPVDMRDVKSALQPIYEQMKQQMTPLQRDASPGLTAIENIVNGPDHVSASTADGNLSAVKRISRGADSPLLRDRSQGLAAKAVDELSNAVDAAVKKAGPDAVDALQRGRTATRSKHEVADVADSVRQEPVQAFKQAVYSNDAGVEQLKAVAKHAPQALPQIGSAFLGDLLDTATADGAFDKAQGLSAKWQKLGPQTKALLFKDPAYIKDLDNFFLLAKKMAENPNPSGTAIVGQMGLLLKPSVGIPYLISTAGLSKILHSPSVVKALVGGLRVTGMGVAAPMGVAKILKIAGDAAQPVSGELPQ